MEKYLTTTSCINFKDKAIQAFAKDASKDCQTNKEKAVAVYNAVRDGWKYYPYRINFTKEGLKASLLIKEQRGQCIEKSILMIAVLRCLSIPSRLCLAKVRNHIVVDKFVEKLGTDELVPHGYVEIFLNKKWIKATPAFNKSLCEKMGVPPLEFDGVHDSVFQAFDNSGKNFMEYIEDYGHFPDVPVDYMRELIKSHYPKIVETGFNLDGDLLAFLESA